ncbi:MAG: phosphatase PAP2 family protein [Labilithrix sp.]|nr:phosphatase PAP2 family protein [Labilithrix sp.]MCW5817582.1 phosphatase PAP2 family protein [Labilithrix sp.]
MHLRTSFACGAALVALAGAADAQPRRIERLGYDTRVDVAVTATGSAWLVAAELLKADLVPEKCRWCYRRANGDSTLNAVDRSVRLRLKWDDTKLADGLSNALAFVIMPAAGIGLPATAAAHDDHLQYAPIDTLLIAEATILAADLNQLVKFVFVRERPFVHYLPHLPDGIQGLGDSPSDANLSFYSGHTNLAFALAASSGTVAFLRGYRLAPLVLGVQLASAFTVGYLRIAADKHYLSDVMVGAVVGSLVGAFVPLLFHGRSSAVPESAVAPTSQRLGIGSMPVQLTLPW